MLLNKYENFPILKFTTNHLLVATYLATGQSRFFTCGLSLRPTTGWADALKGKMCPGTHSAYQSIFMGLGVSTLQALGFSPELKTGTLKKASPWDFRAVWLLGAMITWNFLAWRRAQCRFSWSKHKCLLCKWKEKQPSHLQESRSKSGSFNSQQQRLSIHSQSVVKPWTCKFLGEGNQQHDSSTGRWSSPGSRQGMFWLGCSQSLQIHSGLQNAWQVPYVSTRGGLRLPSWPWSLWMIPERQEESQLGRRIPSNFLWYVRVVTLI